MGQDIDGGRPVWATGVMTGTSMDGIDIAMIETDGVDIAAFGPAAAQPIEEARRDQIRFAIRNAPQIRTDWLRARDRWPRWLRMIDADLAAMTAAAVAGFDAGRGADGPDGPDGAAAVLGVHGQTVLHRPDEGFTLQIGVPAPGARLIPDGRVEVVDFRSADMAAGGQGAPLAPFYHFALARRIGAASPIAFLNVGGVANVTWVDPTRSAPEAPGALIAFDTGPGNALIDDWMRARTGAGMDRDGAAAARGRAGPAPSLSEAAKRYLDAEPPKSLDRNDFAPVLAAMEGLSVEDGAATLTAFTADCVADAVRWTPSPPTRWLVCGGGRLNPVMMAMLADRLAAPVEPVEAAGLDGDMLEAQAFAYLAVRAARGLPLSAPGATGCAAPATGGRVSWPAPKSAPDTGAG